MSIKKQVTERVFRNKLTTFMGIGLIVAGLILLILDLISGSDFAWIGSVAAAFAGAKDNNLTKRLFNINKQNN
jgi:hypothetical protein